MPESYVKVLAPDGTSMFEAPIGAAWEVGDVERVENPAADDDPRGPLAGRGPDLVIRLQKAAEPTFEIVEGEGPAPMVAGGVPKEDLLAMSKTDLQHKADEMGVDVSSKATKDEIADAIVEAQGEAVEGAATEPTLSRVGAERQVTSGDADQDERP